MGIARFFAMVAAAAPHAIELLASEARPERNRPPRRPASGVVSLCFNTCGQV